MPTWDEVFEPPDAPIPRDVTRVAVRLGRDTYNTCNPGVGDADGDGLDELAVPVIDGDDCRICLYRGDGSEVWRNTDVRFHNFYYHDRAAHRGTHWHARSRHRHLFTRIMDIDGDGRPEVVCGDGPVWVLDGHTGATQWMIDVDAHVQTWCPAHLAGPDAPPALVAGIERRNGAGSAIVAIGTEKGVGSRFSEAITGFAGKRDPTPFFWEVSVEGRSFEDAVWAGDVDGDGRDEIVFSPASTKSMFLMDCAGRVRWRQRIEGVIGDDTHVDDLVIDSVLPGADRQILMATGPALLDRDGRILWTRGEAYDHAQRVLAVPTGAADGPRAVYFCESYARNAHLLDHDGNEVWSFAGFQSPRAGFAETVTPRLTTAGCLLDWLGTGDPVIAQSELIGTRRLAGLEGSGTFYVLLLTTSGEAVGALPFEDACDGVAGAMCAVRGRFAPSPSDGIAVITHGNSRLYFFSRATARHESVKRPWRA